jgi:thiosulfate/3-mercaptopyruvate sulfurtransferase
MIRRCRVNCAPRQINQKSMLPLPLIVEPEELVPHLDDVMIIDLSSEATYVQAHLPGALHVSPAELVSGQRPAVGKLPDITQLEDLFGNIGYAANRHIVVYDDEGGGWAGRMLWTLDVIGHVGASYLNGGIHASLAADLPISREIHRPTPTDIELTINHDFIATKDEILASLEDQSLLIWDARGPDEYIGAKVVAQRGGRIPGAINFEWTRAMDPNRQLRIRTDIAAQLAAVGIDGTKPIATHCQTHHRSGFTYLVGKSLGFDIKAYDGSWSEWGNDPDTPIEIG